VVQETSAVVEIQQVRGTGGVDIHLKRKRDRAEGLHLDESSVLYIIDVYF